VSASWNDHFHLCPTATPGNTTTSYEWKGSAPGAKPQVLPEFSIIAAPRRALDGSLHPHVLTSGATPVLITDWSVLVKCDDWDDVTTWSGYLGTNMFFIFHYHDAVLHNSYTQEVLIAEIGKPVAEGTEYGSLLLPVHLMDASQ